LPNYCYLRRVCRRCILFRIARKPLFIKEFWYTKSAKVNLQYYRIYHTIRQRGQVFVPEKLQTKYNTQVQAGAALYVDQVLGIRKKEVISHFLTPEERLKFFEHNVYYALNTTDEYVWCYSEKMNWWQGHVPEPSWPAIPGDQIKVSSATDRVVPEGLEKALVSARQKYEQGKPLGFDMSDIIKASYKRKTTAKKNKK